MRLTMQNTALKFGLKELYQKYLIPIFFIGNHNQILFPKTDWKSNNFGEYFINKTSNVGINYFKREAFYYASFQFDLPVFGKGTVLLGPCGMLEPGSNSFTFLGHKYLAGVHYIKDSKENFEHFCKLVYLLIYGELPDEADAHWHYDQFENPIATGLEQNLYERRTAENTLDSYEFELHYIEAIRRNEADKIKWLFKKMSDTYSVGLSGSTLEDLKYKYSGLITLLTRVSINEGVPADHALSLSDALFQHLRNIYTVDECLTYIEESSFRFMDLIHLFPYSNKSKLIKNILNYIDEHIYDRITLEDLAIYTKKHKTHLTSQFKKEVGQTIHAYINQRKIQEAEHLLLFTDSSQHEISSLLGYSSQSHFIQTFRKFSGMTPDTFKNSRSTYYF
jgi:AraC-like DNA-binding protein